MRTTDQIIKEIVDVFSGSIYVSESVGGLSWRAREKLELLLRELISSVKAS